MPAQNKLFLTFLMYFVLPFLSKANEILRFEYQTYIWQTPRQLFPLSAQEVNEPVLVLKDKRVIEYVYDANQALQMVETVHKIIRINSQNALNTHNKIYIAAHNLLTILHLQARFISASGKITNFDQANLKELTDQTGEAYKLFAIEGAAVGGEIEYFYTLQKKPMLFGREILQTDLLAKEVEFELIAPKQLIFEAKSYNGLPEVVSSGQKYKSKNTLSLHLPQLPASTTADFGVANAAKLMRIDFKLAYNAQNPDQKLFTWANIAQLIGEKMYDFRLQNLKKFQPLANKVKEIAKNKKTHTDKIQAIEEWLKTTIRLVPSAKDESLEVAFENNYANSATLTKLFLFGLQTAQIPHQLVVTSNRQQALFDSEFPNWYCLEKYLIWFPTTQQFLSPTDKGFRYGFVPYQFTDNQGLFIDFVSNFAYSTIQKIPAQRAMQNTDRATFQLSIDPTQEKVNGYWHSEWQGYYASPLCEVYAGKEDKQQFWQNYLRQYVPAIEVNNLKLNGKSTATASPVSTLPTFSLMAAVQTNELLQKAGDKLLFDIGKLLTLTPPTIEANSSQEFSITCEQTYQRTIIFNIPAGYIVRNLEDLNFSAILATAEQPTTWFQSHYTLEGNRVTVHIAAVYGNRHFAATEKQGFEEIIGKQEAFAQTILVLQPMK